LRKSIENKHLIIVSILFLQFYPNFLPDFESKIQKLINFILFYSSNLDPHIYFKNFNYHMVIRVNHFENHFQSAIDSSSSSCSGPLDFTTEFLIIIGCCIVGLIWAFINMFLVSKVDVAKGITGYDE